MNRDKVKVTVMTAALMLCGYTVVQEALNQKDLKASELVKTQIMSNNSDIVIDAKTKYITNSKEKSYRNCKRLVIICDGFNADAVMISGTGKYKNKDANFTVYGSLDNAQRITVNGQQIGEAVYMEKVGDIIKVNLGQSGLEITNAKCVLTGKSTKTK